MTEHEGQANVPSAQLKAEVVSYCGASVEPVAGCDYVAGRDSDTGRLIVVVDGNFDRLALKTAISEARARGLAPLYDSINMLVYCETATYAGPGIHIKQFAEFGLARHQAMLSEEVIKRVLSAQGEDVDLHRVCHYPTLEALAQQVRSSENWRQGEVFCCALDADQYVVMKQIAPSSCEMLTITQNGFHDVLTAYRFAQDELVSLLKTYVGPASTEQERAADPAEALSPVEAAGAAIIRQHTATFKIEGAEDIQLWHALLSLKQWAVSRGIDFDQTNREVDEHLADEQHLTQSPRPGH